MKLLRALTDYGWKHQWALLPIQIFCWGVGLALLPIYLLRERTEHKHDRSTS